MTEKTRSMGVLSLAENHRQYKNDSVAEESPLSIFINDQPFAVVMRTPGDDEDLVRGLLWHEGIVAPDQMTSLSLSQSEAGGEARVTTAAPLDLERFAKRQLMATAGCGLCGLATWTRTQNIVPCEDNATIACDLLYQLPIRLKQAQTGFQQCGSLHGAAAFSASGELLICKEDIGRHNAVDKVAGWLYGRRSIQNQILVVSSRISYEIVEKAAVSRFAVIVAVSAPSSMAIQFAERARITLCGFVRDGRANVYTHDWRIQTGRI